MRTITLWLRSSCTIIRDSSGNVASRTVSLIAVDFVFIGLVSIDVTSNRIVQAEAGRLQPKQFHQHRPIFHS
ncbi:hypothetical protein Y032_0498g2547 [Ancylostoma ceylanicum]|uniref:Uncharacterized protein n=1 Tax=Ancylostoma ceylanicum TaxID=53326 RepID=A0A016WTZ8_9BILA|nr:hypothetical protein Y032_0498g2547 [Ancylostoma ceylanicum]